MAVGRAAGPTAAGGALLRSRVSEEAGAEGACEAGAGAGVVGLNGGPLFRSRVRSEAERELGEASCPDRRVAARTMANMA